MTAGDDATVQAAEHLFDGPVRTEWATNFLQQPGHHLCLAMVGIEAVGFVSGVEIIHPDKGTEMLLYELGVDEAFRRRGIGRALVDALAELAQDRGCSGMGVLTDGDNAEAIATYRSGGAAGPSSPILFEWTFPTGGAASLPPPQPTTSS